mgnify:CR=1 FL=1
MPVQHARVGGRHRVVEAETGKPAMDEQGEPIDGGGYDSADEAIAQVQAINKAVYGNDKEPVGPGPANGDTTPDNTREALSGMLRTMPGPGR